MANGHCGCPGVAIDFNLVTLTCPTRGWSAREPGHGVPLFGGIGAKGSDVVKWHCRHLRPLALRTLNLVQKGVEVVYVRQPHWKWSGVYKTTWFEVDVVSIRQHRLNLKWCLKDNPTRKWSGVHKTTAFEDDVVSMRQPVVSNKQCFVNMNKVVITNDLLIWASSMLMSESPSSGKIRCQGTKMS